MNKDIHILFGLRIKELRVRAHISQEELHFVQDYLKIIFQMLKEGQEIFL